jgi:hypothetical protein
MKVLTAIHHDPPAGGSSTAAGVQASRPERGPNSAGRLCHFAPFWQRQMIAAMIRRRSWCWVLRCGRQASISGARGAHCPSGRTRVIGSPIRRTSTR